MAEQLPIPQQGRAGLNPQATPVSRMITPPEDAPQGPMPSQAPQGRTMGENYYQQMAGALGRYADDLLPFSPKLGALRQGMYDLGNPIVENNIKSQKANARLLVQQSQKTFAELVESGEISKNDNPWFIAETKLASGRMQARRYLSRLGNAYDSYWEANKHTLDEQAFSRWHGQHKSEYINAAQMKDADEVASFEASIQPYLLNQETKHISNVHAFRENKIEEDFTQRIDLVGPQFAASIDEIQDNKRSRLERGETVDVDEINAANITVFQEAISEVETAIRDYAKHSGLKTANRKAAEMIVAKMSDPNEASPIWQHVLDNLVTNEESGATLGDTKYVQELLRKTEVQREIASSSLSDRKRLDWTNYVANNPMLSNEELMETYVQKFSDNPVLVGQARSGLPDMRKTLHGHLGKLSPQEIATLNQALKQRRIDGTWDMSIEEFHALPVIQEILSSTADQGKINQILSPGFFNKIQAEQLSHGKGYEGDNILKFGDWITQTQLAMRDGGMPPLTYQEAERFITEELEISTAHPHYNTMIREAQKSGLFSPWQDGYVADEEFGLQDWAREKAERGEVLQWEEVLAEIDSVMPGIGEKEQFIIAGRILSRSNGPTSTEQRAAAERMLTDKFTEIISNNPDMTLDGFFSGIITTGSSDRSVRSDESTEERYDISYRLNDGSVININLKDIYNQQRQDTADTEFNGFLGVFNEFTAHAQAGSQVEVDRMLKEHPWLREGQNGLVTKALNISEKGYVPAWLTGRANQALQLATQLSAFPSEDVFEVSRLMDGNKEVPDGMEDIASVLSQLQDSVTVWQMLENSHEMQDRVFMGDRHPLMSFIILKDNQTMTGGQQVSGRPSAQSIRSAVMTQGYATELGPEWTIMNKSSSVSNSDRQFYIAPGENYAAMAADVERFSRGLSHLGTREAVDALNAYVSKNWKLVKQGDRSTYVSKRQSTTVLRWDPNESETNPYRSLGPNADYIVANAAAKTLPGVMADFTKFSQIPESTTRELILGKGVDAPEDIDFDAITLVPLGTGIPRDFEVKQDGTTLLIVDRQSLMEALTADGYRLRGGEFDPPETERPFGYRNDSADAGRAIFEGTKWLLGQGWKWGIQTPYRGAMTAIGDWAYPVPGGTGGLKSPKDALDLATGGLTGVPEVYPSAAQQQREAQARLDAMEPWQKEDHVLYSELLERIN